jgi:BlaI family penicillinase repressor
VQSLINRLVGKGALTFEQHGREYIYRAAVEESRCVHEASRTFVDRVFSGKLAPLLACFLDREKISKGELEEIRKLIEENQA